MGIGPKARLDTPPPVPSRYGLLKAADSVGRLFETADAADWGNGYGYEPDPCGLIPGGIGDPCAPGTKALDVGDGPTAVDVDTFFIWDGYACTTLGGVPRDWDARARRKLVACQSKRIEDEFWTGTQSTDAEWGNRFLASPTSDVVNPSNASVSVTDGIACLEQGLADCGCGGLGMIHVTPATATHMANAQLLDRDASGILTTKLGTIVVPGAGYDGSGPNGEAAAAGAVWAYATGVVTVRLGPVDVHRYPDRSVNTMLVRAERIVGVDFDGCCLLAAELDHAICGVGGS